MAELVTFIAVFSLGLTASFSPCLFPVLPSFVAFLTQSDRHWGKSVIAGALVTLGIMTVFVALGLVFTSLIGVLSIYYNFFRQLQGLFLIILGILLVRNITLNFSLLNALNSKAHDVIQQRDSNHWITAYLLGLFFAVLSAPCAAVAFITLFTILIAETAVSSMSLMLLFSIGAGIPFLLMGGLIPLLKDSFGQEFRQFQQKIPQIAGIVVILVGVVLILEANNIL